MKAFILSVILLSRKEFQLGVLVMLNEAFILSVKFWFWKDSQLVFPEINN